MLYQKRVILKISGEALKDKSQTFSEEAVKKVVKEILPVYHRRVEIGIVLGGGNIVRGRKDLPNTTRSVVDEMGMLITAANALFLQDHLENAGIKNHVQSACEMNDFAGKYTRRKTKSYLEDKDVVIFACGTGNPGYTTDSAAALRAFELGAEAILKGTKVEGFYENFPPKDGDKVVKEITFQQVLTSLPRDILDLDTLAFLLRKNCKIPLHIFDIFKKGNLLRVVNGEPIGTKIVP